ncbi:MAG: OsmC family peroxiredoxin [Proteobacteria bacterium]|nr:OsmC family peroxiredoxin [Pseudomonadota bacterium]
MAVHYREVSVWEEDAAAGWAQEISVGGQHKLKADEPEALGGKDTGATPMEMLMSALGACTTMTLRMYVRQKGWAVGKLAVTVTHRRGAEGEKRDIFHRALKVEGALDEAQRARLVEIADKCPVSRALSEGGGVETELV